MIILRLTVERSYFMYVQITTRCNMTCAHCCFSCTLNGDDMSRSTFKKVLDVCRGDLFLGGGEPTMHPEFEVLLCDAMTSDNVEEGMLGIITNGTYKKRALLLAKLHSAGIVNASLSWDQYHDKSMVSEEVRLAYQTRYYDSMAGGKRLPNPVGRGADLPVFEGSLEDDFELDCPCPDLHVKPNGDVRQCGCDDAPYIGNVNDTDLQLGPSCCWKDNEYLDWEDGA